MFLVAVSPNFQLELPLVNLLQKTRDILRDPERILSVLRNSGSV